MIKNNKGITLTTLVITILVLTIIVGITGVTSYKSISEYRDNRLAIELGIVRQAIVERYEKAKAVGKLKSEDNSNYWIGEKLDNFEEPYNSKNKFEYPEDWYYKLDKDNLEQLGLSNSNYTYIVNYSTGEVYNETKQRYSTGDWIYLGPLNTNQSTDESEDDSFKDWIPNE